MSINSITRPTMFTDGQKDKGKVPDPHCLPLTDWVRGTEHLQEPREHFLSWELEHNKPILKVISAKGSQEFTINMMSDVKEIEVSPHNLGPILSCTVDDDRQASSPREPSLIIKFVVRNLRQNPAPKFLQPGAQFFLAALPSAPNKRKVLMVRMV